MNPNDYAYDTESFPNFFCVGFAQIIGPDDQWHLFEISDRRNDSAALFAFLTTVGRLVGFNNFTYDWPMVDHFLTLLSRQPCVTAREMYQKNVELTSKGFQNRFQNAIWNPSIPQIDLFMLHHLDRFSVGLKQIEFALRARNVMDSNVPFDTHLTPEQMDKTIVYNANDIRETKGFARESAGDIAFRETFGPEFLCYSNGKIGKKIFEQELKAAGIQLYTYDRNRKRQPRQTPRPYGVRLADVILPFIKFTRAELQLKLEWIKSHVIGEHETKGGMKTIFDLDGFEITVGLGGIHGSLEKTVVRSDHLKILDVDVTSYYPSIAIVHRIFPEHLTETFCDVYGRLKARRVSLAKDDPNRTTLKFALNVPFGESNSPHDIFYDPAYMLAITVNGQLMLCMLAEQFANISGVELIQVNTDGVTIRYNPSVEDIVQEIIKWWSHLTGMDLESNFYNRMFIRDANSYIAEKVDGKRKRIGAFDYEKEWYQDHSQLIIPKAAEAAMLDDVDVEHFIETHPDPWDFLLFRKGKMQLTDGTPLDRNVRYYIAETGQGLVAIYPPLSGKTEPRRIGRHATGQAYALGSRKEGYRCSECATPFRTKAEFEKHNKLEHCFKIRIVNEFDGRFPDDLNYQYYIEETNKLVIE